MKKKHQLYQVMQNRCEKQVATASEKLEEEKKLASGVKEQLAECQAKAKELEAVRFDLACIGAYVVSRFSRRRPRSTKLSSRHKPRPRASLLLLSVKTSNTRRFKFRLIRCKLTLVSLEKEARREATEEASKLA